MNDRQTDPAVSEKDLWDWIPTNEFSLPSATIQTTFKTRVQSLLRLYQRTSSDKSDGFSSPEKLEYLSTIILDRLVPPVDWKIQAQSLDPFLMPWCGSPAKKFVVIQNVPHSGNAEILKHWAAEHDFRIIDPPNPFNLMTSAESADVNIGDVFKQFENTNTCWVLPNLERFYLRHEEGLFLIRRFFKMLLAGELGFGVVGCSSWAWSFFRHAMGISAPISMVAKPFDSKKLAQWLIALACESSRRQIQFRQSDSGRVILSSASKDAAAENSDQSPYLRDLAAFSYGIPGVALAYWRASLQTEPDTIDLEKDLEKSTDETTDGQSTSHPTVWVKPWINIEKPGLPKNAGRNHAFILHSLLLHDTLDMDMLAKLLPERHLHFGQILYDLSDNGLIELVDEQWRVSPKGYPVVRAFLKNEGFLTDDFL
jgi:hypothetical protein